MKKTDRDEIISVIGKYLWSDEIREMKEYIQHGEITTYRHVINVVKLCYLLDKRFNLKADKEVLLTSALLHDFYGYDWHNCRLSELHGFKHPLIAADRAGEIFGVDDRVMDAIRTHMWPFTLLHVPKSKEAWILTVADKLASMSETLWMRGGKKSCKCACGCKCSCKKTDDVDEQREYHKM